MSSVTTASDGAVILYDADLLGKIESAFFDPEFWRRQGALVGEARGRGAAWFVQHDGRVLVLRHYRRGGLLGPWLGDRYLWLGLSRTRAFREWHLLTELRRLGLPVPHPVAVRVRRSGFCYRADLVTRRIDGAESLAQSLAREPLTHARWQGIGRCLRRFHDAGVWHADLNAHNVLLAADRVYLIDFDRGRLRGRGRWPRDNLARLKRSLDKLAGARPGFHFDARGWAGLRAGYDAGEVPRRGRESCP